MRHHEQRFAAQEAGWCDYLLAHNEAGAVVGHVVVRRRSKYPPVIDHLGEFPEIQALAAYPTGRGTGSALLDAAERTARYRGATIVGLAVEHTNSARQLYERRGYRAWDHGDVVDEWSELANDGTVTARHRDVCDYLLLDLCPGDTVGIAASLVDDDSVRVRPATTADLEFVKRMLYEAANRPGDRWPSFEDSMAEPRNQRFWRDWSRPGDVAVIAEAADRPVGAAWATASSPRTCRSWRSRSSRRIAATGSGGGCSSS
ncbi:MAG: GNAT family N-acetyltransferase [Actinobacteria bacterium]|nr:GNAT family N-acetyltransferase [Actinomycetota bacterium]